MELQRDRNAPEQTLGAHTLLVAPLTVVGSALIVECSRSSRASAQEGWSEGGLSQLFVGAVCEVQNKSDRCASA